MMPICSPPDHGTKQRRAHSSHWQVETAISACMSSDMSQCATQSEGSQS